MNFVISTNSSFNLCLLGFKRYIIAGIIASALGMMLGVHNIFSIIIQMSFRLVTGAIMLAFGTNLLTVILSGPLVHSLPAWLCGRLQVSTDGLNCCSCTWYDFLQLLPQVFFYKPANQIITSSCRSSLTLDLLSLKSLWLERYFSEE